MILELHNSLLVSVLQRQPTALSNTHLRLTIISSFNKLFHFYIFLQIDTLPGMELQSWYPVIKQEGDHVSQTHSFLHPRWVGISLFVPSFNIYIAGAFLGSGNSLYHFRVVVVCFCFFLLIQGMNSNRLNIWINYFYMFPCFFQEICYFLYALKWKKWKFKNFPYFPSRGKPTLQECGVQLWFFKMNLFWNLEVFIVAAPLKINVHILNKYTP